MKMDMLFCSGRPASSQSRPRFNFAAWLLAGSLLAGCGRKEGQETAQITNPQQAASQLEQAFNNAPDPTLKQNAQVASQALKQGDYEKAVLSLQAVKSSDKVTLDQGLAVHGTTVMLETRLIQAMESGDANAKRAYELLKAMKRK